MQIGLTQAKFSLDSSRGISLADAAGAEVEVLTGRVWLTTDGDIRDIVLPPGDAHIIERDGLTIINAIEPSLVQVRAPQPQPAWWRRWLTHVWNWLVAVGEARARARMRRGIHYF